MDKYDIIIEGGQSNAEGSGLGPVEKEYEPREDILYLDAEKDVVTTPERIEVNYKDLPFVIKVAKERPYNDSKLGDLALTFSEKYIESGLLKNGRKILIVRGAIGGTGFQKGHWGVGAPVFEKMLEMTDYALSLNPENKVVGFLWHQGEHDAFEGNTPANYKKQLLSTVETGRAKYGKTPFIAGDFSNEWKSLNIGICEPIIKVIKEVVDEVGCSAFVETADLPSNNQKTGNGDNIHFCRQSLHVLGERYFNAFMKII